MGRLILLKPKEPDEAIARGLGMSVEAYRERKALLLRQVEEVRKRNATIRRLHKGV